MQRMVMLVGSHELAQRDRYITNTKLDRYLAQKGPACCDLAVFSLHTR